MFNTKYITEWERSMNRALGPKGYKILIGLIINSEEQRAIAILAKLDAEKPKNFFSDNLPEGVYRLEHTTFEGLLPLVNRKLTELINYVQTT